LSDTAVQDEAAGQPPDEAAPADEQVRVVQVPPPWQFGATPPIQQLNGPIVKYGPDCPVFVILGQGGWRVEAMLAQNDALNFANHIRKAVKQAQGGIQVHRNAILGPNGQPLAVPDEAPEDDDLSDLEDDQPVEAG
jgi:hypothetical protein